MNNITAFELEFAMEYAMSRNATRSMAKLRPELAFQVQQQMGSELLQRETVQSFLATLGQTKTHNVFREQHLTFEEKRSFLASVVKSSAATLDEDSPLIEEVTSSENDEGVKTKRVKMMSKAKALQLDNAMAGHNAPELSITADATDLAGILRRVTGQVVEAEEVRTKELWAD